MTDEQIRQRAVSIAVEAAEADTIQTYTSERPFVPHEWVVRAIAKALKERTPVQVGRAVTDVITEIVERATASVREASERTAALLAKALERIELLEAEPTGHGVQNRIAEALEDHRALSGRVQALVVRVDQLEAGRTGAKWIGDMGHAAQRHLWPRAPMSKLLVNGRPRDVTDHGGGHYSVMLQPEDTNLGRVTIAEPPEVHPDHLQTVHEVAADGGDDMARGILQLTKERDEARRALKAQHDQYEHEIEQYKNAAAERERSRVAAQREADTVRESLEMAASDRDRFNAGLTDANGRIAELQAQRDNTWRLLDHRVDGQPFYSEQDRPIGDMVHEVLEHYRREIANLRDQLRVADADRVPLRMDLDIATAHLKERTAECDRMRPLVAAAQRMAGSYTATAWPEPFRSVARHVIEASEAYEIACSQAADEDDDGFANAAANEGARIAAESRAEAESDPGTVSG
jgi:hypothetical protein